MNHNQKNANKPLALSSYTTIKLNKNDDKYKEFS
jgi:hypothetical protein